MTHAIRLYENGGPEVLKWEAVELGDPGPGQVRVRHGAVGLNFIDVYFRTGLYPLPQVPGGIGLEGAGVIEALGDDVEGLTEGDRVAYAGPPPGAYAEARVMPAAKLVKLPPAISDQQAAAMMLQGLTAQYLIRRTYRVQAGDTVLFHAAAGGVGLIACQWLKHLGATVIGTVGSEAKAELARAHGCDHTILYRSENFVERVREITDGAGVPVAYDSVRPHGAAPEGLALPDPPHSHDLHRQALGPGSQRRRALRRGRLRRRQDRSQPDLPARRSGASPHGPGGAEDHGVYSVAALRGAIIQ
jgi:NADPH2:quinone reductase